MATSDILQFIGIPLKKKKCCICKSSTVKTLYHGKWYCEDCFHKKQLCCICGENPVEVTYKDSGYCRSCYDSSLNQSVHRSLVIMAVVFGFILLEYFFLMKTRVLAILSILLSIVGAGIVGYAVHLLIKRR